MTNKMQPLKGLTGQLGRYTENKHFREYDTMEVRQMGTQPRLGSSGRASWKKWHLGAALLIW